MRMNSLDVKKNIISENGFIIHQIEVFSKELNQDIGRLDKLIDETNFQEIECAEYVISLIKNMQEKQQIQEKMSSHNKELEFLKNEFKIFLEKYEELKSSKQ